MANKKGKLVSEASVSNTIPDSSVPKDITNVSKAQATKRASSSIDTIVQNCVKKTKMASIAIPQATANQGPVTQYLGKQEDQNWKPVIDISDEELALLPMPTTHMVSNQESVNFTPNSYLFAPTFHNCSNVTINFNK